MYQTAEISNISLVNSAYLMTFEHRTYNTAPSAPIATVASAVRALVVKINTSARRWRALEEGVDIAMGLSSG